MVLVRRGSRASFAAWAPYRKLVLPPAENKSAKAREVERALGGGQACTDAAPNNRDCPYPAEWETRRKNHATWRPINRFRCHRCVVKHYKDGHRLWNDEQVVHLPTGAIYNGQVTFNTDMLIAWMEEQHMKRE